MGIETVLLLGNAVALWKLGTSRWVRVFFFEVGAALMIVLYVKVGRPEESHLQALMLFAGGLACMWLAFRHTAAAAEPGQDETADPETGGTGQAE